MTLLREDPAIELRVVAPDDHDGVLAAMAWAEAVTVRTYPLTGELLGTAPGLRLVSKHGIGTDNIDVAHCTERGIPVAIAAGSNDRSVAEWSIMALLAIAKRATMLDGWVRAGAWERRLENAPRDIEDRTLLVVGLGRIGRRVARMAAALDMAVIAYDPWLPAQRRDPAIPMVERLEDGLARADAVSLHMPRTPETEGMLGRKAFEALKPGALLVNASRGGIVDEAALREALDAGILAGAALDVLEDEPPAPDDPMLARSDVLLSPHAAALTQEGARRMAVMAASRVLDLARGTLEPGWLVNAGVLDPPA